MSRQRSVRPQLNVENLEQRRTPATFNYAAGTLTVVATQNEDINVAALDNAPAGYFLVTGQGNTNFNSLDEPGLPGRPIKNIVIDLSAADTTSVTLADDVNLGGSLTIVGSKVLTVLLNQAEIGKNFTFTGTGNGVDNLIFDGNGSIGGNVALTMGGGDNQVQLQGGKIYGSLAMVGGANKDSVKLNADGNMTIGGSASIKLGAGEDEIVSAGNGIFAVGGDLLIVGGADRDRIDMDTAFTTAIDVGGDLTMKLGTGGALGNTVGTSGVNVGGNLAISGGADIDSVGMFFYTDVGGTATFTMGDGDNSVDLTAFSTGNSVTYTGGLQKDEFQIDAFQIGKNLTVNTLGNVGIQQENIFIGANDFIPCQVFGSVNLKGGAGATGVFVARTAIGGKLTIGTGAGNDAVFIDDSDIIGATSIKMGAGDDALWIDNQNDDQGGDLGTDPVTFGGSVTVNAGAGDDTVLLSSSAGNQIRFGSALILVGGDGTDILDSTNVNQFFGIDGVEDFENGNGVELK